MKYQVKPFVAALSDAIGVVSPMLTFAAFSVELVRCDKSKDSKWSS